jgi:hypothetical protein
VRINGRERHSGNSTIAIVGSVHVALLPLVSFEFRLIDLMPDQY